MVIEYWRTRIQLLSMLEEQGYCQGVWLENKDTVEEYVWKKGHGY